MSDPSAFVKVNSVLRTSFEDLKLEVPNKLVESIAKLIVHAMSNDNRTFHRASHALDLTDSSDSLLDLAALFHDLVYFQVDEGFPPLTEVLLQSITRQDNSDLFISDDLLLRRPDFKIVMEVFGFLPGQRLNPLKGQNEFLSAVVAYEKLSPFMSDKHLMQIFACIEATIPFRADDGDHGPLEILEGAVRTCNKMNKLGLTEEEILRTMKRSVELANRDVRNFSSEQPSWFLATTWLLLPERNIALRSDTYTIRDYRISQERMASFFDFLQPDLVFKRIHGHPSHLTFKNLKDAAEINIRFARTYLRAKLVAIAILEALAAETGGDLPMVELLGKVRPTGHDGLRMEDFLPNSEPTAICNSDLLHLMEGGRALEAQFDLKNSPLAAFIYKQVGDVGMESLGMVSKKYFSGQISAGQFIAETPPQIFSAIAKACAEICVARAPAILHLIREIKTAS